MARKYPKGQMSKTTSVVLGECRVKNNEEKMFEKHEYKKGEIINFYCKNDRGLFYKNIKISLQMAQVFEWYDCSKYITPEVEIEDSDIKISFTNNLDSGVYVLVSILREDGTSILGEKNNIENYIDCFYSDYKCKDTASCFYNRIKEKRKWNVQRPKFRIEEKNVKPFDVFVFAKNILLSTVADYEDIQVVPYEYLSSISEINYINKFFNERVNTIEFKVREEIAKENKPSVVFVIQNIMAFDYNDAEKFALEKIDCLNNIFSLLLKCHGTYFGIITFNTKDKMTKINILDTLYKGNLFLLAENGFNIRHFYSYLSRNNTYLNVYLKLLNEAIKENERLLKYYRFWNILEGLANTKNYENKVMKKWNGNIVVSNGRTVRIKDNALDKVFELLRNTFAVNNEKINFKLEQIKSEKEFLSVCYQRRNCCAHQGDCFLNDKAKCLDNKETMQRCKNNNVLHTEEPIAFQDKILRELESITMRVLMNELKKDAGDVKISSL